MTKERFPASELVDPGDVPQLALGLRSLTPLHGGEQGAAEA